MELLTRMGRNELMNPKKDDLRDRTWIGLGVQTGGGIIAGFEHIDGGIFNMNSISRNFGFKLNNMRLGLRAGFGTTIVTLIALNCKNIQQLNGLPYSSTDFSLAVGAKWDTLANSLREYKFFSTLAKIFATGKLTKSWEDLNHLWEGVEKLTNMEEFGMSFVDNEPNLLIVGIGGTGVDIGLSHSFGGRVEIY